MAKFSNGFGKAIFYAAALISSALVTFEGAHAQTYTVLHAFAGYPNDGSNPYGSLVSDSAGNMYGTTYGGGDGGFCGGTGLYGCGTVYKIAPDGTETILHKFAESGGDGALPYGSLVLDAFGNLYGVTELGGNYTCFKGKGWCGTVFKVTPDGTETVLYAFNGGNDGSGPTSLISDKSGNLYGTTLTGGGTGCARGLGCGTIFKRATDGSETVLYSFPRRKTGYEPLGGLLLDQNGNLYGTTLWGGRADMGTVFRLSPDGKLKVLHEFSGSDGAHPESYLIMDRAGNLVGTTPYGGPNNGYGTVYELTGDGTETILYTFTNGQDGGAPSSGLITDKRGNYYGTTSGNYGAIYKLAPDGRETVLYSFASGKGSQGSEPWGGLLRDSSGNIYGTTSDGDIGCNNIGCGVVFSLQE